ncbi:MULTISPECIES: O-antigen ligase family protein [Listeria]|uniref:O-antigen ligase family protein n=1 Tax=Listeria TaxID=1637 RepID=UPI000B589852|nr:MULTISPECIES: O-antigen ligase family protein [Listeria]
MAKTPLNIAVFIVLVAIFPLIDFLNGFFLTSGYMIPIGIVYRFFFFIFLISMICIEKIPKTALTFVTFLFIAGNLGILLFQSIILQNPFTWIAADISVFVKYFLWALIPYYIYQRKTLFQALHYEKIFIVISLLFTVLLLVPYALGVGHQTYDNSDAGYKGFFFANNDTSFAFIVSLTFTAQALIQSLQGRWNFRLLFFLLLYSGNMLCLLLVGTKTGIVYGVVISVIVLIRLLFFVRYRSVTQKIFVWFACLFLVGWLLVRGLAYAGQLIAGTYDRMVYFYHLYDGNLVRLLTSSRSDFLEGGLSFFLDSLHPIFTVAFGQGFEYRLEQYGRLGLIEMDFFDTLFGLGLFGILLLVTLLGYYGVIALKKQNRSLHSFLFFIIILYSFFAGHVLFSALSSTLLGLVCGGIILSKKE